MNKLFYSFFITTWLITNTAGYTVLPNRPVVTKTLFQASKGSVTALRMAPAEPTPATFREAEIIGLRFMQEGNYEEALAAFNKGMKLPGSRSDVVRTKILSGPSPVGGSFGGLESQYTKTLDEFELQAAHYNMACAHAQLGNINEAIANIQKAFDFGFDNYATVRGDPDLSPIKSDASFEKMMEKYDPKGFNPFGFLGKK